MLNILLDMRTLHDILPQQLLSLCSVYKLTHDANILHTTLKHHIFEINGILDEATWKP